MCSENHVWERRWHPLLLQWVVYASHRQKRPWNGQKAETLENVAPTYDPCCNLCPGNTRISKIKTPNYSGVYVFDNDHPGLSLNAPTKLEKPHGIYANQPAVGIARVLCYSDQHNTTLTELEPTAFENVVAAWQSQTSALSTIPQVSNVSIFENKGKICGVSNEHPHGQIFGTDFTYTSIEHHLDAAENFNKTHGKVLFQEIINSEQLDGRRIICENEGAISFIPYFARYAFEVYISPKKNYPRIDLMPDSEVSQFTEILRQTLIKLDNLWHMSFPYLMKLHQAPVDNGDYRNFHFHIQIYPPLRTPNLQKHLGAIEIGGQNFHADTSPEQSARVLNETNNTHYKVSLSN
ncbi:galactose-1-phosphate uridylyltransferase [Photobacterium gaetbulicola]|uniref:Galactose-1-phosphate uridylyltransferase n=1 Tax=Photobacterium gaetbulicola Gung47 TaxID=658445 RepID=A0A0C5WR98_9GAMM|nr:galactose-1-phosphate uridylyltransferase [Photobacterium gaetbulicola]AJR05485.1 putative galactose-1-phosphate uridylyltransferase [Photobacterium gaetbulicola Gung47]PSU12798.1 galactose-1-phosphate uridylyltransferase [Photobacterium gaetbulicola]